MRRVKVPSISPGQRLLLIALAWMIVAGATVGLALRGPWLGLELRADPPIEATTPSPTAVRVVSARGPSAAVPPGAELFAIAEAGSSDRVPITADDLIDEPDLFDRYEEMDAFFARQTALRRVLLAPEITLHLRDADGGESAVAVRPAGARSPGSLPGIFWFQLAAGCVGLLVAAWVLVLRSTEIGVRMFALMGASILGFTAPAALYSTRELALDGEHFRVLSALNHFGANAFGVGLVGLFLSFPKPLVRSRWLWAVAALFLSWAALDVLRVAPDQTIGARLPIMTETVIAIGAAVVQWRRAKDDPRARASLRWFGVSVLGGASLFVSSVVGAGVLGMLPIIPQGYSFGFFLLMHVGLALGLRRTRLFELNELSYLILLWTLGAIALLGADAAVLYLLDTSHLVSSSVALLFVGFAYLPLRAWLWSRATGRREPEQEILFRRVLDVVFAVDPADRARRYRELFDALFSPLDIAEVRGDAARHVEIREDGLALYVPAVTSLPALKLALPWRGRGLFGERHAKIATTLRTLTEHAEDARDAFDRGVREERARVARDLHDDVGAALTSGLYQEDPARMRQAIQAAILEMRSMVNVLTGRRLLVSDVVGDLRHETVQRAAAARVGITWPLADFGARTVHSTVARNWASMVRELTSNVIRHARAEAMSVTIDVDGERLVTMVTDDGVGFDGEPSADGNGVRNLRRRADEIGGTVTFSRRDRGTLVRVVAPLEPAATADVARDDGRAAGERARTTTSDAPAKG